MEYIPLVDEKGFAIATLYDIFHAPSSPYSTMPYAFYISPQGELLYIGYLLEKKNLWRKVFRYIIGLEDKEEIDEEIQRVLSSIKVPLWDSVASILVEVNPPVNHVYLGIRDKLRELLTTIFSLKKIPERMYVLYGFTPIPSGLYGSMLDYSDEYILVSVHVNDLISPEKIVDIMIHEMLHGLFRINDIELKDDVEEMIIDISSPEGYLSKILGLTTIVKVDEIEEKYEDLAELAIQVINYYENKVYEQGIDLFTWLKKLSSHHKLPFI